MKLKLKEVMETKRVADTLKEEVERFSLVGFEVPEATEKTTQLDSIVKGLMAKIQEIEDLGIKLRDIDTGLIDFPAKRFGETVFLCWRYGEQTIEFWHSEDEGFASRKQLNAPIVSP